VRAVTSARSTAPAPAPVTAPAAAPAGDLPRRTRQASLAPQLREAPPVREGVRVAAQPGRRSAGPTPPGVPAESAGPATGERSAEQARSLISSVQRGWRSGRAAAEQPEAGEDQS
jgi:hypothetical protein